jgi:hypothetical protein
MPKEDIDYSNTIIYKIYCKDKLITDIYVGHTTNFIQRKYSHKICCNSNSNKLKIYEVIRDNGGWENWEMEEIEKFNCSGSLEARQKEQEYYELLNPTLNSVPPFIDKVTKFCNICKIQYTSPSEYTRHLSSNKHILNLSHQQAAETGGDIIFQDTPISFNCLTCNFYTYIETDYNKHLVSQIHNRNIELSENPKKNTLLNKNKYLCECGKEYKHRQGLWKHLKICEFKKSSNNSKSSTQKKDDEKAELKLLTELVKDVIKHNQDLTNKIIDLCQTSQTNNTIANSNVHSNNKTFNLQFFLNETCKDAMNISDFVESIKFQIKDLEHVGEAGFVEGISDVVLDNLNDLDTVQRPIHCSDNKREILYIKDNNEWVKDDQSNTKMSKIIKQIAHKNMKIIPEWVKKHPDCYDSSAKSNDKYLQIVSNSMSGGTELEQKTNINKIISRVAKEVTIDKNKYVSK